MTYEEYFKKHGSLTYRNTGTSMLPMLQQGRDLFTVVRKTQKRCRKYDVVLYRRSSEQYVLHRIVKVLEDGYVLLGDNCEKKEYKIKEEDILAVLSSFVHSGKKVDVFCWKYKLYEHAWYWCYPIRKLVKQIKRTLLREIRAERL